MDYIFLISIILLWIISAIFKKYGKFPQAPEAEKEIFLPKERILPEKPKEQKIEKTEEEKPILKKQITKVPEKEKPELNIIQMLKSKSTLRKAIILNEILGKPLSER